MKRIFGSVFIAAMLGGALFALLGADVQLNLRPDDVTKGTMAVDTRAPGMAINDVFSITALMKDADWTTYMTRSATDTSAAAFLTQMPVTIVFQPDDEGDTLSCKIEYSPDKSIWFVLPTADSVFTITEATKSVSKYLTVPVPYYKFSFTATDSTYQESKFWVFWPSKVTK